MMTFGAAVYGFPNLIVHSFVSGATAWPLLSNLSRIERSSDPG